MTEPLPPHWRQVERITKGPVFTVSCRDHDTRVQKGGAKRLWWRGEGAHHAGAAADGAALHLAAWLVTFPVAALAGGVDVDAELLVDALRSLGEGQLHDVLYSDRDSMAASSNEANGCRSVCVCTVEPPGADQIWH